MKNLFLIALCCILLLLSGCSAKYQRISFDSQTLGEELALHVKTDTAVVNTVETDFPDQLPIYSIKEHNISQSDYTQLLEALDLPDNPWDLELEGNRLYYSLAGYTDYSRGYFDMTDEEVEQLAWEIFNKIPFMEGEYECIGIRETVTLSDQEGEHITRVGVSFCKLLSGGRVIGEDDCILSFDGSGLVSITIELYDYEKIGTMDMISIEDAAARIKTPDQFRIEADMGVADTLHVDRIKFLLVNQYSDGCTILQPVYNFIGTASFEDGNQAEFQSMVIAIPESYTYEVE